MQKNSGENYLNLFHNNYFVTGEDSRKIILEYLLITFILNQNKMKYIIKKENDLIKRLSKLLLVFLVLLLARIKLRK
jgi:hypothetical protein